MDIQKEGELFEIWWENHGQYNRAGGGDYEKTFAWESWIAAKAQAVPDGYKVVPVNYECVWCGCTELDGWTDETMIKAQEPK